MDSEQDLIEHAPVELQVVLTPTFDFAFYQNSVRVIRDLAVANESETAPEAIELGVASEPGRGRQHLVPCARLPQLEARLRRPAALQRAVTPGSGRAA
jgi:hypothetical protein